MVCDGGEYEAVTRGISLGCPLSPLMGTLYLKPLDNLMERQGLPYVRYMDDWVILAKTRWALRRVVQQVNTILDHLKLEKHPDKTFIGRIDRGFDFSVYRSVVEGLRLAAQTKQRFVERATRLYEQGAAASRIGEYVRHWLTWVRSGGLELVWDAFLDGVTRVSDSGPDARPVHCRVHVDCPCFRSSSSWPMRMCPGIMWDLISTSLLTGRCSVGLASIRRVMVCFGSLVVFGYRDVGCFDLTARRRFEVSPRPICTSLSRPHWGFTLTLCEGIWHFLKQSMFSPSTEKSTRALCRVMRLK